MFDQLRKILGAATHPNPNNPGPASGGGASTDGSIQSIGGHINGLGGTLGTDNGRAFGNWNINGVGQGSFGPNDSGFPSNTPQPVIQQFQQNPLAREYYNNPADPKFLGVDPQIFGYPEDISARPPAGNAPQDFSNVLRSLFRGKK